jgi:hypothetical protein
VDCNVNYAKDHFPDRWRIFGIRLLPFAVGHKLILQAIESPLVTLERKPEIGDLVAALWVCSRPYSEARAGIVQRLPIMWRWHTATITRESVKSPDVFESRVEMFRAYMGETRNPEGTTTDVKAEKTYAPQIGVLKLDLMECYGFSEEEFLNMPLKKAMADRALILSERDKVMSWPEPWESQPA